MNGKTAFALWTKAAGRWSQWLKPALFSGSPDIYEEPDGPLPDAEWLPAAGESALVLDLKGAAAVSLGVALSRRGYCPVPMYNTTSDARELVATGAIAHDLLSHAESVVVNEAGPPVFLADQLRDKSQGGREGDYDNRWRLFSSDFPSAAKLQEHGVKRLVVVTTRLADDVRDALAKHVSLQLSLLDPDTKQSSPMPAPDNAFLRGLSAFVYGFTRPPGGGPYGHRIMSSSG